MSRRRRVLLFVPVFTDRFLAKAHERNADGIILDLEDAIAPSLKQEARKKLATAAGTLATNRLEVWVRVNHFAELLEADLSASVLPGVYGVIVPKVESRAELEAVDRHLTRFEQERGLAAGRIKVAAILETPAGILAAPSFAGVPRLCALTAGAEDLAAAFGVLPTGAFMRWPAQFVATAAVAQGLEAWGLAGSVANFSRLPQYERSVRLSFALGLSTILCIHPAQVTIVRKVLTPHPKTLAWAREAVSRYEASLQRGEGSIAFEGEMIDAPVYAQAKHIVARAVDAGVLDAPECA
jgi:citrate lyase subunit beta / citryl-CoA lyase